MVRGSDRLGLPKRGYAVRGEATKKQGEHMTPIVMGMRYSVLGRAWVLSRLDVEEYRRTLFDPERLRVHCSIMKHIMLPSLAAQIKPGDPVSLYIMTSAELPAEAKRDLYEAVAPYEWVTVLEVEAETPEYHRNSVEAALRATGADGCTFAHLRIDDDDALSNDFLNRLRAYIRPQFAGYGVSLSAGFAAVIDPKTTKIVGVYKMSREKVALGLSTINTWEGGKLQNFKSIYSLNHSKIDTSVPTILDARRPAYLRTIYPEQDTAGVVLAGMREVEEDNAVLRRYFPYLEFPTPAASKAYLEAFKARK